MDDGAPDISESPTDSLGNWRKGREKIPDLILEKQIDLTEFKKLTPREQEILEAMSQGLNNREISATLFISLSTIRTHISNMISSLNVQN